MGGGIVDLTMSSVKDGSTMIEIVIKEIFKGVLGITSSDREQYLHCYNI